MKIWKIFEISLMAGDVCVDARMGMKKRIINKLTEK